MTKDAEIALVRELYRLSPCTMNIYFCLPSPLPYLSLRLSLTGLVHRVAVAAADAVVSRHRQMTSNGYFKNDAVFVRVVSKCPIVFR